MRGPLSERSDVSMALIGIDITPPGEPKNDWNGDQNDKEQRDDGKR